MLLRPMLIINWSDNVGGQRNSFWTLQNSYYSMPTQLVAMAAAAGELSNAGVNGIALQIPLLVGTSPVSGPYNCGDAASFYVKSGTGLKGELSVPGLKPSILLGDGVTVDQTNTAVVTFLSDMSLYLGDTTGAAWTSVRQANRTRFPG